MDATHPRVEDLRWMAETGENAEGAAARLGLTFKALERYARRHAPDAWTALLSRRPRDHNRETQKSNQWRAA